MDTVVDSFVKQYKIAIHAGKETEVKDLIKRHITSLIHNVVSLSAIVAMLHSKHKIEPKHMQAVRTYVISKCGGHIKGGMSMASDYFGYPHPSYNAGNYNQGVQASDVNWAKNEARPSHGPQMEGGARIHKVASHTKELSKVVKTEINVLHAQISKQALVDLLDIIDRHLLCFADDILKEGTISVKKLQKILAKRRHSVFQ